MRILAIDYGKRRCGIAVTDTLQIIANGLCTVDTPRLMDFLKDYVKREPVETIVMGLPTQTNGEASENQQRVRQFAARLKKEIPQCSVEFYDERFTSVMAHRVMLDSGIGKMKRRDKALTDEISACIILQDFLEHRRFLK